MHNKDCQAPTCQEAADWTLSQRMSTYWDNLPESSRRRKLVGWIERNTWLNRMDWRGQHIGSKP